MSAVSAVSVLMVDDEPNVLDGYRRSLHGRFQVVTANSGTEALTVVQQALNQQTPFPVIVSDMMMPGMNGAEFLGRVREIDPDAVQMLLSGQADLESTIAAVNNGNLFRFLTKPCATPALESALAAAFEQHRLVRAERELLERTLAGAIDVLTELLSLASPEAFAKTQRARTLVEAASAVLGIEDWRLPLATMLSQIGCIAVPGEVLHRAQTGGELEAEELEIYLAHPKTANRWLERIPRLEEVARWVGDQPIRPPGQPGTPSPSVREWDHGPSVANPDLGEQMLRAALAFLGVMETAGQPDRALAQLIAVGRYPQQILDALEEAGSSLSPQGVLRELPVDQIRPGMVLEMDVETITGMTLLRKGERVTEASAMRLENFARTVGVKEPIQVLDGA
jgi:CheY-like chemotaxis protein